MVRRYDVEESPYGGLRKEDCPHGGSVDYDDYAALQESHARLLEASNTALSQIRKLSPGEPDYLITAIAAAQPFTEA